MSKQISKKKYNRLIRELASSNSSLNLEIRLLRTIIDGRYGLPKINDSSVKVTPYNTKDLLRDFTAAITVKDGSVVPLLTSDSSTHGFASYLLNLIADLQPLKDNDGMYTIAITFTPASDSETSDNTNDSTDNKTIKDDIGLGISRVTTTASVGQPIVIDGSKLPVDPNPFVGEISNEEKCLGDSENDDKMTLNEPTSDSTENKPAVYTSDTNIDAQFITRILHCGQHIFVRGSGYTDDISNPFGHSMVNHYVNKLVSDMLWNSYGSYANGSYTIMYSPRIRYPSDDVGKMFTIGESGIIDEKEDYIRDYDYPPIEGEPDHLSQSDVNRLLGLNKYHGYDHYQMIVMMYPQSTDGSFETEPYSCVIDGLHSDDQEPYRLINEFEGVLLDMMKKYEYTEDSTVIGQYIILENGMPYEFYGMYTFKGTDKKCGDVSVLKQFKI